MSNHLGYPGAWELAQEPNPELLRDYLRWVVEDPERFESAANSMQWLPVGFNALTIATEFDTATNDVGEILQLNFYHGDYPGNEHPHGHSRWAYTSWYASPETRQRITRHLVLPEGTSAVDGLAIEERQIVTNAIIDKHDGRRPDYHPTTVGTRLILEQSATRVAPRGSQSFGSLEAHNVAFEGQGVAVSAHYKKAKEPQPLSESSGLVDYKGLTLEQAEMVTSVRSELESELLKNAPGSPSLGRATMVFPALDFDTREMEATPTKTPDNIAERLLLGGLATAESLAKLAA